jgi:hypothetical protein
MNLNTDSHVLDIGSGLAGRRNHGFVDLRGRPDLAIEIPEGSQSPALKGILVELSEPDSPLFTLGCDLGTHEEPWREESARHVAATTDAC